MGNRHGEAFIFAQRTPGIGYARHVLAAISWQPPLASRINAGTLN